MKQHREVHLILKVTGNVFFGEFRIKWSSLAGLSSVRPLGWNFPRNKKTVQQYNAVIYQSLMWTMLANIKSGDVNDDDEDDDDDDDDENDDDVNYDDDDDDEDEDDEDSDC